MLALNGGFRSNNWRAPVEGNVIVSLSTSILMRFAVAPHQLAAAQKVEPFINRVARWSLTAGKNRTNGSCSRKVVERMSANEDVCPWRLSVPLTSTIATNQALSDNPDKDQDRGAGNRSLPLL
jgi:hypothetical protein